MTLSPAGLHIIVVASLVPVYGCSETPIVSAVRNQDITLTEKLLKSQVSPNQRSKNGEPLLNIAIRSNSLELTTLLLKNGADPNVTDNNGASAVHCAAEQSQIELLQSVIASGGNIDRVNEGNRHFPGKTPIFYAIDRRRHANVEFLIEAGASIDHQEGRGFTPPMWAVECGMYKAALIMLKAGADTALRTDKGMTVFDLKILDASVPIPPIDDQSAAALKELKEYARDHKDRTNGRT